MCLIDQFFLTNDTLFLADSLTAMETWVVGCLVFVFFALLEYGIVLRMVSSSSQKKDEIEHQVKAKKAKKQRTKTLMGALQVWQNQGQNQVHEMPNNESKLSVTQTLSELRAQAVHSDPGICRCSLFLAPPWFASTVPSDTTQSIAPT